MNRIGKKRRLDRIAGLMIGISFLLLVNRIAETFYRTGCVYAYLNESVMYTFSQLFILFCVICGVKYLLVAFGRKRWDHFTNLGGFILLCIIVVILRSIWIHILAFNSIKNGISIYPRITEQPVFFHRSMVIFTQISVICPLLFILSAKVCAAWRKWYSMPVFTLFCIIWAILFAKNDLVPELAGKQDIVWNLISDVVLYIIYLSCGYFYFYKDKVINKAGSWGMFSITSIGLLIYETSMLLIGKIRYIPDYVGDYYEAIYIMKRRCAIWIPIYIAGIIAVLWILAALYRSIAVVSAKVFATGPLIIIIIRWGLGLCCALFVPVSNVFLALPFYGPQAFYEMMLIAVIVGCCFIRKRDEMCPER